MRISLSLALVTSLTLGACGYVQNSALNPSNWFGRSAAAEVSTPNTNPLIPATRAGLFANRNKPFDYNGIPFEEVIDLKVERIPGGAIIRATGRAARQGEYLVQLTPANEDEAPVNGVLTYRLEGVRPTAPTAVGTPPTREVTAARQITDQDLRGVRSIRVEGQLNARVVSR